MTISWLQADKLANDPAAVASLPGTIPPKDSNPFDVP